MRKIPLPRIGMRTIKTAVAVTLSYLIFVPFGLLYNENYPGVLGYIGPLYACIPCVVCMQSSLEQTFQVGLSRFLGVLVGAVIGALMIATIDSAIPQLQLGNSMITEFIKGILLLFAILLNVILQRIADKQALARRGI